MRGEPLQPMARVPSTATENTVVTSAPQDFPGQAAASSIQLSEGLTRLLKTLSLLRQHHTDLATQLAQVAQEIQDAEGEAAAIFAALQSSLGFGGGGAPIPEPVQQVRVLELVRDPARQLPAPAAEDAEARDQDATERVPDTIEVEEDDADDSDALRDDDATPPTPEGALEIDPDHSGVDLPPAPVRRRADSADAPAQEHDDDARETRESAAPVCDTDNHDARSGATAVRDGSAEASEELAAAVAQLSPRAREFYDVVLEHGPIKTKEVARRLHVSIPTATNYLKKAERFGLAVLHRGSWLWQCVSAEAFGQPRPQPPREKRKTPRLPARTAAPARKRPTLSRAKPTPKQEEPEAPKQEPEAKATRQEAPAGLDLYEETAWAIHEYGPCTYDDLADHFGERVRRGALSGFVRSLERDGRVKRTAPGESVFVGVGKAPGARKVSTAQASAESAPAAQEPDPDPEPVPVARAKPAPPRREKSRNQKGEPAAAADPSSDSPEDAEAKLLAALEKWGWLSQAEMMEATGIHKSDLLPLIRRLPLTSKVGTHGEVLYRLEGS